MSVAQERQHECVLSSSRPIAGTASWRPGDLRGKKPQERLRRPPSGNVTGSARFPFLSTDGRVKEVFALRLSKRPCTGVTNERRREGLCPSQSGRWSPLRPTTFPGLHLHPCPGRHVGTTALRRFRCSLWGSRSINVLSTAPLCSVISGGFALGLHHRGRDIRGA